MWRFSSKCRRGVFEFRKSAFQGNIPGNYLILLFLTICGTITFEHTPGKFNADCLIRYWEKNWRHFTSVVFFHSLFIVFFFFFEVSSIFLFVISYSRNCKIGLLATDITILLKIILFGCKKAFYNKFVIYFLSWYINSRRNPRGKRTLRGNILIPECTSHNEPKHAFSSFL